MGLLGDGRHHGASVASRWPILAVHEVDLHLTPRTGNYSCGAVIAEVAAPEPLGRLLVACHGNSWAWWAELPRRMKAVLWRFRTAEKVAGTLSAREVEVLRLLSGPLSLRDIGKELFISHDTVKSHVKAIYHKLGVSSRKEAVALSRKLGLVP
jgi:DNA-binding CsgD family transcriptional regulator